MNAKDLVGTWKLVSFCLVDPDGKISEPWEGCADGLITYTDDGYMSAGISRIQPNGERLFLYYGGPYRLEGTTAVHSVEVSLDPALIGGEQRRGVELDGDQLVLSVANSTLGDPNSGARIIWRRPRPRVQ